MADPGEERRRREQRDQLTEGVERLEELTRQTERVARNLQESTALWSEAAMERGREMQRLHQMRRLEASVAAANRSHGERLRRALETLRTQRQQQMRQLRYINALMSGVSDDVICAMGGQETNRACLPSTSVGWPRATEPSPHKKAMPVIASIRVLPKSGTKTGEKRRSKPGATGSAKKKGRGSEAERHEAETGKTTPRHAYSSTAATIATNTTGKKIAKHPQQARPPKSKQRGEKAPPRSRKKREVSPSGTEVTQPRRKNVKINYNVDETTEESDNEKTRTDNQRQDREPENETSAKQPHQPSVTLPPEIQRIPVVLLETMNIMQEVELHVDDETAPIREASSIPEIGEVAGEMRPAGCDQAGRGDEQRDGRAAAEENGVARSDGGATAAADCGVAATEGEAAAADAGATATANYGAAATEGEAAAADGAAPTSGDAEARERADAT